MNSNFLRSNSESRYSKTKHFHRCENDFKLNIFDTFIAHKRSINERQLHEKWSVLNVWWCGSIVSNLSFHFRDGKNLTVEDWRTQRIVWHVRLSISVSICSVIFRFHSSSLLFFFFFVYFSISGGWAEGRGEGISIRQ